MDELKNKNETAIQALLLPINFSTRYYRVQN